MAKETMSFIKIKSMQKTYGLENMQNLINTGDAWHMEGAIGRGAMDLLGSGACMLPKERKRDAYGNTIPSREDLQAGTKGTYLNSKSFWTKVWNGEIVIECEEDYTEEGQDEIFDLSKIS